ncbi:MAG TPA: hypothetical protein VK636_05295 [Gemmatimonadaceae bacterium]|nr:hypothetical protein [Gemmatimonadaceae bacterium]
MIAPDAVASVGSQFGESAQGGPPRKDLVERAQKYTEHLLQQLAEMRAQKLVQDEKLERWKADVKVKELAKAKTRQLAEEEARTVYSKESPYAKSYAERTQKGCARQVASLAHLDRMDAEAKRLLTGNKAARWRALATSVSAASRDGIRDYHDHYALAEALVAEDGAWLEAELKTTAQPSGPDESTNVGPDSSP